MEKKKSAKASERGTRPPHRSHNIARMSNQTMSMTYHATATIHDVGRNPGLQDFQDFLSQVRAWQIFDCKMHDMNQDLKLGPTRTTTTGAHRIKKMGEIL